MRFRAFSVATILALGIFTLAAHADTVTYQISFSTSPTTSFPFLDPFKRLLYTSARSYSDVRKRDCRTNRQLSCV